MQAPCWGQGLNPNPGFQLPDPLAPSLTTHNPRCILLLINVCKSSYWCLLLLLASPSSRCAGTCSPCVDLTWRASWLPPLPVSRTQSSRSQEPAPRTQSNTA